MKKLEDNLVRLESFIPKHTFCIPAISSGSVGWHIEHSLLVFNAVINALSKSNPSDYKKTFDIRRSFVLTFGKIPRGKAKAPAAVQPTLNFNTETLKQHIAHSKEKVKTIENLRPDQYFNHPFLGDFKTKLALRFLSIHTNHHLRIIGEILNK